MLREKTLSKILAGISVFCISLNTLASTITVNWDGTGDFIKIQKAINASIDGDIIIVMPGVYAENVNYLEKDITLRSCEPTNPTIIETTQITPPDKYLIGSDGTFEGFRLNGCFKFGGVGSGDKAFSPKIHNCHIVAPDNFGIYCKVSPRQSSNPVIENNIIQAYTGFHILSNASAYLSKPIIRNNTFVGEGSKRFASGIRHRSHNDMCEIYNNIFVNYESAILFTYDTLLDEKIQKIRYNDFYGNTSDCIIQGVEYDLTGVNENISNDPLFVDYENGDYHLQKDSPCINDGDPNHVPLPDTTDYEGNPRIINGIVDMGAYEFIHPVEVSVDIKPQSCPNPINVKSNGVLPVAILGSDMLDVNDIDYDTVRLEGVAPLRGSYEDVASPVIDDAECACTTKGADDYIDLALKFKTQEVIEILGDLIDGELWMLYLTGNLKNGTPIEGSDCIVIKKKGKDISMFLRDWLKTGEGLKSDLNLDNRVDFRDFIIFAENR